MNESKMSKSECERATDYTLPPLPESLGVISRMQYTEYGQQCAEVARAPLLARIAELESELQLERHSLLWACNVYMVDDMAEGADRAQRAVAAANRVRGSVRRSLDLHKKKESGDA